MQKLIKSIREYLGLSQTEFADKIGVTFATVNRWENGHAIPTKLAQTTLYEYCKEHGVPVYQMILEKIKADADAVSLDGDRILLYHGSKSGIVGEIAPKSREMCDFGKGFYMGTDPGQPLTLICEVSKRNTDENNRSQISADTSAAANITISTRMAATRVPAFFRELSAQHIERGNSYAASDEKGSFAAFCEVIAVSESGKYIKLFSCTKFCHIFTHFLSNETHKVDYILWLSTEVFS